MKVAVIALVALLGLSVTYTSAEEDVNAVVTRKLIDFNSLLFFCCCACIVVSAFNNNGPAELLHVCLTKLVHICAISNLAL